MGSKETVFILVAVLRNACGQAHVWGRQKVKCIYLVCTQFPQQIGRGNGKVIQINMQITGTCYERVASKMQTSEEEEIIFHWGKSLTT